ncbi:MAG: 3',5'-cyclic-nucleotide phosphodiesterase [Planctomycetes bacterium]|nr:3',5'-cyclic-nucleotide phosphodiesterase [Planctomycetota bacterium]
MKLRVLGCHGGTTRDHKSVSFLIDRHLALDAGSLASGLSLEEMGSVQTVLVTHPHIDHIADLGTVCDSRTHLDLPSLVVAGMESTLDALRAHFFNNILWPDFTRIRGLRENVATLVCMQPLESYEFGNLRVHPVPVDHSIPSCGFIVEGANVTLAYSGDTGPTQLFWETLNRLPRVDAVITEVSFPNRMKNLATRSGHLTPRCLEDELEKLAHRETPILIYGLKPPFEVEIREELDKAGMDRTRLLEVDQSIEL